LHINLSPNYNIKIKLQNEKTFIIGLIEKNICISL